jgi:hypothetical protein
MVFQGYDEVSQTIAFTCFYRAKFMHALRNSTKVFDRKNLQATSRDATTALQLQLSSSFFH